MHQIKPLVSVIVTSYNYAHYIAKTIESVLNQSYGSWEMIISDDHSTDRSLEVIHSFNDPRIKLITSRKNRGAHAAYTKAYNLCTGKYIISLDSDDYMAPERIKKQVEFLEKSPDVGILCSFIYQIDEVGNKVAKNEVYENWFNKNIDLNDVRNWIWANHLAHSSVVIRKDLHQKVGFFNPELLYSPDYEFWVRCL